MTLWQLKTINGYKYVTDINKVSPKDFLSAEKLEVEYVCETCGEKLGKRITGGMILTTRLDCCDFCGKVRGLCHVRHFNYLRK